MGHVGLQSQYHPGEFLDVHGRDVGQRALKRSIPQQQIHSFSGVKRIPENVLGPICAQSVYHWQTGELAVELSCSTTAFIHHIETWVHRGMRI